jgi:PAS domain S-box-containing protein
LPEIIKPVKGYAIKSTGDHLELDSDQKTGSSEGVIIGNLWGYIYDVNDELIRLYGAKDKSEFVGKHMLEFVNPKDKKRVILKSFKSIKIKKPPRTATYNINLKNGKQISVKVSTHFLENEDSEKVGFLDIIKLANKLKS